MHFKEFRSEHEKRKFIVKSLLIGLAAFIILKSVIGIKGTINATQDRLPSTYVLPEEYNDLVAPEFLNRVKVNEVMNSKIRPPFALLTLDQKYSLIVAKLQRSSAKKFDGFVIENKSERRSTGVTYAIVDNNLFKFQFNIESYKPLPSVYLTMSGDSVQKLMQSDSVLSYHLLCRNFSLRYADDAPIDIYLERSKQTRFDQVLMEVLLYKRGNDLLFYIIAPNDNRSLETGLINSIAGLK